MVNFTKKRLQVFVSSTYTDMLAERQAAVESILTSGNFPAGMELFTAGDESQMDAIKQWIDESDIYLLILGGRYGSIEPKSGKSYIHLEYEYALEQRKPFFACVLTEAAIDRKVAQEGKASLELSEPKKLNEFRMMVLSKLVKLCEDPKDIKIAVGETLASLTRSEKLIGWVKADSQVDMPALADEIARLSRENAQLRSQISPKSVEQHINGLTFDEVTEMLSANKALKDLYATSDALLAAHPQPFGGDRGIVGPPSLIEAVKLGLLSMETENFGGQRYKITEPGRVYLSRLRLEMLRRAKNE